MIFSIAVIRFTISIMEDELQICLSNVINYQQQFQNQMLITD